MSPAWGLGEDSHSNQSLAEEQIRAKMNPYFKCKQTNGYVCRLSSQVLLKRVNKHIPAPVKNNQNSSRNNYS